jgi:hypothetical protein
MKSITSVFLLLSTVSIAQASDIKLNCTLEYDIDDKVEIEIPGIVKDNKISFKYTKNNASTYYFKSAGSAVWHSDAQVSFEGELKNGVLTYNYDFKNYLRDESKLVSVFNETRSLELDFEEINDGEKHYFDFNDGVVLESTIDKSDWINDEGIKLSDCEIYDNDLIAKDESISLTPRQQRRLERRQGPGFFERLFND